MYVNPFSVHLILEFFIILRASPDNVSIADVFNLILISPYALAPLKESWPANLARPYIDSGFWAVSIFCSTVESSM